MKYGKIVLERNEFEVILGLLRHAGYSDQLNEECCIRLQEELKEAIVKDEDDMPDDVVRINSIIDVETSFGIKKGIQLVIPSERNIAKNKISILSPMGSALIGYARKDEVLWSFPKGKSKVTILNVVNTATA